MERPDWYAARGLPHQLGILLSGVPGSGKTAIIRAVANMTGRHIVAVNFASIKTVTQLKNLFYSEEIETIDGVGRRVSLRVPVDNRVYVLDEIDALGSIVHQRGNETTEADDTLPDELTLGAILQTMDGTLESPGRILIITSNRPDILDSALIRPGRIDLKLAFGPASRELILEVIEGFFGTPLLKGRENDVPDRTLTPAEVSNILFEHVYLPTPDPEAVLRDLITAGLTAEFSVHRKAIESPATDGESEGSDIVVCQGGAGPEQDNVDPYWPTQEDLNGLKSSLPPGEEPVNTPKPSLLSGEESVSVQISHRAPWPTITKQQPSTRSNTPIAQNPLEPGPTIGHPEPWAKTLPGSIPPGSVYSPAEPFHQGFPLDSRIGTGLVGDRGSVDIRSLQPYQ
jgi:hypothetical protein